MMIRYTDEHQQLSSDNNHKRPAEPQLRNSNSNQIKLSNPKHKYRTQPHLTIQTTTNQFLSGCCLPQVLSPPPRTRMPPQHYNSHMLLPVSCGNVARRLRPLLVNCNRCRCSRLEVMLTSVLTGYCSPWEMNRRRQRTSVGKSWGSRETLGARAWCCIVLSVDSGTRSESCAMCRT